MPPPAVILVTRGVADPVDMEDVSSVLKSVRKAFPCYQERLAFSSCPVRALWRKRGRDAAFRDAHPGIDKRIYGVGNVISALASVQETGPRLTLVQGLQLIDGPEYYDLSSLVVSLRQIKTFDRANVPFPWIGLGQPALGLGEGQPVSVQRVAAALSPLFEEAEAMKAGLLLAADPAGGINPPAYRNLAETLKAVYGYVPSAVAVRDAIQPRESLEGFFAEVPPPGPILAATLAPVSNGDAAADLDGPRDDSWAAICRARGYKVETRLRGLCSNVLFADLLVENLKSQEEAISRRYMME
jgi:cobalamin biosynthesis Co2+ chelatase CbiK